MKNIYAIGLVLLGVMPSGSTQQAQGKKHLECYYVPVIYRSADIKEIAVAGDYRLVEDTVTDTINFINQNPYFRQKYHQQRAGFIKYCRCKSE